MWQRHQGKYEAYKAILMKRLLLDGHITEDQCQKFIHESFENICKFAENLPDPINREIFYKDGFLIPNKFLRII